MRLPRMSVRRLMIGVAAVAVILLAALSMSEAVWVGSASIPLEFLVLDSATGRPINEASIRLAEGDPGYRATTGPDGRAKLVIRATTAGHSSLGRSTRAVAYGVWSLVISADGYKGLNDDLGQHTREPRFHSDPAPPPIMIRLAPEPPNL